MRLLFFLLPILLLAFSACARKDSAGISPAPEVADWRLAVTTPVAGASNPSWIIRYDGPNSLIVRLTRLSSNTLAFSSVQSWRPEPGKLAFFHGRYFGIVQSAGADQRTLNRFVSAFERTLPE